MVKTNSSWQKLKEEKKIKSKILGLSTVNSKYEEIIKAKKRYNDIKIDHKKLIEEDILRQQQQPLSCRRAFDISSSSTNNPNSSARDQKNVSASEEAKKSYFSFYQNNHYEKNEEAVCQMVPELPGEDFSSFDKQLNIEQLLPPPPPPPLPSSFLQNVNAFKEENEEEQEIMNKFEKILIPTHGLEIGTIESTKILKKRLEIEYDRMKKLKDEAESYKRKEIDLILREDACRKRIEKQKINAEIAIKKQYQTFIQKKKKNEKELLRKFIKAKNDLYLFLKYQKASIQNYILDFVQNISNDNMSINQNQRINWNLIPQPIEIRLHLIRGIKNRLPRGKYLILVSMQDTFGAQSKQIFWEEIEKDTTSIPLTASKKPSVTKPKIHGGRFFDIVLSINESIFCLLPNQKDIKPENILIFEIFRLADKRNFRDTIVGFFALPIINHEFEIIHGKFKLPVFRGLPQTYTSWSCMHQKLYAGLNTWLGNIYLEIRCIPKEKIFHTTCYNQQQIEFDFIHKLLHHQSAQNAKNTTQNYVCQNLSTHQDETDLEAGNIRQTASIVNSDNTHLPKLNKNKDINHTKKWWQRLHLIFHHKDQIQQENKMNMQTINEDDTLENFELFETAKLIGVECQDDTNKKIKLANHASPWYENCNNHQTRNYKIFKNASSSEEEKEDEAVKSKNDDAWWLDLRQKNLYEEFRYALGPPLPYREKLTTNKITQIKLKFIFQELFQDWNSFILKKGKNNNNILLKNCIFVGTLWLRSYIHYLGQWLLLVVFRVVIYGFHTRIYGIEFKYSSSKLTTLEEVSIVAIGPFTVIILFCFLFFFGYFYRFITSGGFLPEIYSIFMSFLAAGCILDPLLIFIIDLIFLNFNCKSRQGCRDDYTANSCKCFEGDAFKLYHRMTQDENGGIVGIFYLIIIYLISTLISCTLTVLYFIKLHMNGRIYDAYCRIFCDDSHFFVPDDFEISLQELELILLQTKKYIGPLNQSRSISILSRIPNNRNNQLLEEKSHTRFSNTTFTSPSSNIQQGGTPKDYDIEQKAFIDRGNEENHTHRRIIIIQEHLADGSSWIHRQFIQDLHSGIIRELFGDAARSIDDDIHLSSPTVDQASKKHLDQTNRNFFVNLPILPQQLIPSSTPLPSKDEEQFQLSHQNNDS
uniref:Uncharacterized protein n=1 Tax=Aureoumbra lagunensis TaxID=44058 RepID=A0A7S3JVJ2_9STRA